MACFDQSEQQVIKNPQRNLEFMRVVGGLGEGFGGSRLRTKQWIVFVHCRKARAWPPVDHR